MPYHEAYEKAYQYRFPASKINAQTQQDRLQLARDKLVQSNPLYKDAMDIASDPNSKPKDVERAKKIMENIEALSMSGSQSGPPPATSVASEAGNKNTVTVGGKTYSFPTAEAAEQFKKQAGI